MSNLTEKIKMLVIDFEYLNIFKIMVISSVHLTFRGLSCDFDFSLSDANENILFQVFPKCTQDADVLKINDGMCTV